MKKTISIITEQFENENTGEKVEGITIMIDGMLKEMFEIFKNNGKYENNASIVQDALMRGISSIKDEISK